MTDWMNLKHHWREQRINREKQIVGLRTDENESIRDKENIEKKLIKEDNHRKLTRSSLERDLRLGLKSPEADNTNHSVNTRATTSQSFITNDLNTFGTSPSFYFSKQKYK